MSYDYTNITNFDYEILQHELKGKDYESYLNGSSYDGTDVKLIFSQELSGAQKTDLDAVMSAHPDLRWQLTVYLDNYRWQRETGGVMSNGYGVDTTDRSKALINGAFNLIQDAQTPNALMDFKTAQGWQSLTHAVVESIALDVGHHIEKCFSAEKHVTDLIWAGTLTTESGVVTEFESEYASL